MIEAIQKLVEEHNENFKCGMCWKFFATGRKDYSNLISLSNECCGIVIIESWSTDTSISEENGEETTIYNIEGFMGKEGSLQYNFYNEQGIQCDDSKYFNIIKPIEKCISNFFSNLCIDNSPLQLTKIYKKLKLNYLDSNLDGFEFRLTYTQ